MEKERITIASRTAGFAWAGRKWDTEPEVVTVADDDHDDIGGVCITARQYKELKRQCQYPLYPLRIGKVTTQAEQTTAARTELDALRVEIEVERKTLADLRAERDKTDRLLAQARKRLKNVERKLAEAENARKAAEVRADVAEAKLAPVQVEPKPDPNRPRE